MNLSNPVGNEIIRNVTHMAFPFVPDERCFQPPVRSKPLFHRINEIVQMIREVEVSTVDFRGGYDCVIQKLRVHGTVGDGREFVAASRQPVSLPNHFIKLLRLSLMPSTLP